MAPRPFVPLRWLRSPHLQTMSAAVPVYSPPKSHRAIGEVEDLRIPLPDGGKLWAQAWWQTAPAPTVLIMHGIAGSQASHCCMRAAVAFQRAGYNAVRLDLRGAGGSTPDAPKLYHGGMTADSDATVRYLLQDARVTNVAIIGFSGGGSIALKMAGEWGSEAPDRVTAIASVSAPLDYLEVARRMDSLATIPYRFHVLRGLIDRARAYAEQHPERAHYTPADLVGLKRFRTYDAKVIVPMWGFDDVDHYYRTVSSGPWLPKIKVPSFILHAKDDPMVTWSSVEPWLGAASSAVRVEASEHGGHLGWIGGLDEASWIDSWTTRQALAFFEANRK